MEQNMALAAQPEKRHSTSQRAYVEIWSKLTTSSPPEECYRSSDLHHHHEPTPPALFLRCCGHGRGRSSMAYASARTHREWSAIPGGGAQKDRNCRRGHCCG